jgi:hypothetical protein
MADYKAFKGYKVASLASDPTVNKGQLWYNTTSNTLKYDTIGAGAWSSTTAVPTAVETAAAFGTSTSGMMVGGMTQPAAVAQDTSFSFNGTSWTEEATLNQARRFMPGIGATNTAGLIVGGAPPTMALTEVYNGTSWTEVNNINRNVESVAGAGGTVTAGIVAGGEPGPKAQTETWDGTNWTEVNDLNTGRTVGGGASAGTPSAFQITGGAAPPLQATTEQYNGTAWTEVNDLNVAKSAMGAGGTTTSMIVFGGSAPAPTVIATAEQWNGTSWTEVGDLATARMYMAVYQGTGTSALAISGRGNPGPTYTNVEEFDGEPAGVKTVTTS